MQYYGDLSGDESDENSASSHSETELDEPEPFRIVLHADVDCFYGQCEMLRLKLPPDRPLAIQQKHIIVTSNYAARRLGVGKLESVDTALSKCPSLLLVNGSDLHEYRKHSQQIYASFRQSVLAKMTNSSVSKGSMDEMMAEWVQSPRKDHERNDFDDDSDIYIYDPSMATRFKEDQSGVETVVRHANPQSNQSPTTKELKMQQQLLKAARVSFDIRETVLEETGFTVTMGISTTLQNAKLASSLRKPATVNILLPMHAPALVSALPLRQVPRLGSATYKALVPLLKERVSGTRDVFKCSDLLKVPRSEIEACLRKLPGFATKSREQALLLYKKCQALDPSRVVDDAGGPAKTVSVEESFRCGTLTDRKSIVYQLHDLVPRLTRLLELHPLKPTCVRVTVRFVDPAVNKTKRRPFVTRSQQTSLGSESVISQAQLLLKSLLDAGPSTNITRLNLAATNFKKKRPAEVTLTTGGKKPQRRMDDFFQLR